MEIERATFPLDDPYEFQPPGKEQTWVVLKNNRVVGFATGKVKKGKTFFLARVGILKEYRKNGLGARLVSARKRYAKKIGCKRLVTYTVSTNTPSNTNLLKHGFQPYEAQRYLKKYILIWWHQKI